MLQRINGFHQDDEAHWVAELACGHRQHVRHDPPWQVREWVLEAATRQARLGTVLECPQCDAADRHPRVGVAVIVRRKGLVLLGRRLGSSHGAGNWQFPGGRLEMFEDIEACGRRELEEETGLRVTSLARGPFTNDLFEADQRHYVTLYLVGDAPEGEPEVREPAKCAEWRWFDWAAMPEPLFLPIRNLKAQGFRP